MKRTGRHLPWVLMDIFYLFFAYAAAWGFDFIPPRINVLLLVFLYFLYLYLLRYVYNNRIGEKGRPVFEQAAIRLQNPARDIVKFISIIVMLFFPIIFLTMCWLAATPEVSFDDYPLLPTLIFPFDAFIMYVNIVVFDSSDSEDGEGTSHPRLFPRPSEKAARILVVYIFPALSVITGCAISGVISRLSLYSKDPFFLLFISLTAFIPFRYLVMRTTGVSLLSLISFAVSILLMIIGYSTGIIFPVHML
ncbi:MAG: hypothetical protein JXA20_07110 [Spirochaetes bacterium]|nr:hypothetical protein [Spirochaetota bacterium]